jgi:hypothetical protein
MQYGESTALDPFARWGAWPPVLDAIEAAMDTPGLPPDERAALADLHNQACVWVGERPVEVAPLPPPPDVFALGIHFTAASALWRAGYRTVEQVAALTRDELLSIRGIGRGRADEVMRVVAAGDHVLVTSDNGRDG